jgi:predicted ester cyclase
MTRADIVALLERHRDAFKRRDAKALAADFAESGVWEGPAHGVVEGRARILEIYNYWFNAFPDLQITWDAPLVDGDRAATFWKFAGTSHGPFFGIVGAGSRVELGGAAEYQFADGAIVRVRHVYDFSSVLVKTGVLKVKPAT